MKTLYESILDDDDILIGNIKKDIDNALEIVGCKDLKHRKLGSLSGGELQRVMLANALYEKRKD